MAWASIADHLTISTLVEKLDTTGRKFDVIPLRRLDAEYVAGTIMTLMGPKEKKENNSRSRYWGWGNNQQEEEEPDTSFRVDADLQDNRLLVYANPVEMDGIRGLLQKLGELPDPDAEDDGYRVFELNPNDDAESLKRKLQQLWQRENKLEFNLPEKKPDPQPGSKDHTAFRFERAGSAALVGFNDPDELSAATDQTAEEERAAPAPNDVEQFFRQQSRRQDSEVSERPPVKISISEDGRLIVACDDPAALAEFENLIERVAKPVQHFKIFTMKYQSPYWVAMTLQEYFELEEDKDDGYRGWAYYAYGGGDKKKSDKHSLSKRRIPQFIYDDYTSTILVRDADARQLQTIEELIKIYDAPSPADTRSMRVTEIYLLKNAKAETVAQAIKDVFRDLLSSNDQALEKPGGEQKQESRRGYSYYDYGGGDDADDDPVKFKGLLSIGIDRESNSLVISAQQRLMPTIQEMVTELDDAAEKSSGVRILQLDPTVDLGSLQDKLSKILGPDVDKKPRHDRQQNPNAEGQQVQPGQNPAASGG